ncbi:MAG: hypothetical protein JWP98_1449 [Edaphobacter sp.]|nr:hypothetical protein [Edaphobacter sp.]
MRFGLVVSLMLLGSAAAVAQGGRTARQIVDAMVGNENAAELHRGRYLYVSEERSERTGGHLWRERVAETSVGKVRMLMAEDGQPLSGDRAAMERSRLADIAAHPDVFERRELALKNDEKHAKQMLEMLTKAFELSGPREENGFWRIDFKPNDSYAPQSLEERVLHGMAGSLLVDEGATRLHEIEGRLPADVSIGFGLVATIKAGSNFSTTRDRVRADEWKTAVLDTDINGRAIFFKAIGRKQHAAHSDFRQLPDDITVGQAVALLLK